MQFLKVEWLHDFLDEPYEIYAELDAKGYERRKLERFKNGSIGYATEAIEFGGSILSDVPYPSVEELARNPEFVPIPLSKEVFEQIWAEQVES